MILELMHQFFFYFSLGDIHQEKVSCETTTFGLVCPGMPCHAQTCLDVPGVPLCSFGALLGKK